jgi:hypothetical protein
MPSSFLTVFAAVATIAVMVRLVRRRRLKEKYAALWLVVAAGVGLVAVLPQTLGGAATLLGVRTPSNLLFFVSSLVLLVISVQLSTEVSQLEEETRSLAEEMALLRLMVEQREALDAPGAHRSSAPRHQSVGPAPAQTRLRSRPL